MGDLSVRVSFGVVIRIALALLLWTSFTDLFVKLIFPKERKVVPGTLCLVAILSTFRTVANVIKDA